MGFLPTFNFRWIFDGILIIHWWTFAGISSLFNFRCISIDVGCMFGGFSIDDTFMSSTFRYCMDIDLSFAYFPLLDLSLAHLRLLILGPAECAERLNPPPPACRGHGVLDSECKERLNSARSQNSKLPNSSLQKPSFRFLAKPGGVLTPPYLPGSPAHSAGPLPNEWSVGRLGAPRPIFGGSNLGVDFGTPNRQKGTKNVFFLRLAVRRGVRRHLGTPRERILTLPGGLF